MPRGRSDDTTRRACPAREPYGASVEDVGSACDGYDKNEETLRQNMQSLYAVVMSLCDSNMEDKVKAHEDYLEIKHTRNTIKLLQVIKHFMCSNDSQELQTIHNQVMSTINLFWMRQERGQSVQNFRDHFTVYDQLGLCIGLCIGTNGAR